MAILTQFRALPALLLLAGGAAEPQAAPSLEQQLKAAYLYNFAKFVEWPVEPNRDSNTIAVCVLGDEELAAVVEQLVANKTANGRPLAVERSPGLPQLSSCHILYVGSGERRRVDQVFQAIHGSSVLTVGDMQGFARIGGVINFKREENKIQFEINVDAADRSRVRISSRLLRVARVIRNQ